jgi:hypothetical protein
MASLRSPETPAYRITLFYGPEAEPGPPPAQRCVFNVKKRSWKGGVQVAVEVDDRQVRRAEAALRLEEWLQTILAGLQAGEQARYAARARELFLQGICLLKLTLALEGLRQENSSLPADRFMTEVDRAVTAQGEQLKRDILDELDLAPAS